MWCVSVRFWPRARRVSETSLAAIKKSEVLAHQPGAVLVGDLPGIQPLFGEVLAPGRIGAQFHQQLAQG